MGGCGVSYKQHSRQDSLEGESLMPSGIALAACKYGGSPVCLCRHPIRTPVCRMETRLE